LRTNGSEIDNFEHLEFIGRENNYLYQQSRNLKAGDKVDQKVSEQMERMFKNTKKVLQSAIEKEKLTA
jgi:hypothetical protein